MANGARHLRASARDAPRVRLDTHPRHTVGMLSWQTPSRRSHGLSPEATLTHVREPLPAAVGVFGSIRTDPGDFLRSSRQRESGPRLALVLGKSSGGENLV